MNAFVMAAFGKNIGNFHKNILIDNQAMCSYFIHITKKVIYILFIIKHPTHTLFPSHTLIQKKNIVTVITHKPPTDTLPFVSHFITYDFALWFAYLI